nr:unnamed protein product [Callosobruchus chinensis]
MAQSLNFI